MSNEKMREMDQYISYLLNDPHLSINDCKAKFLIKYPNEDEFFEEFMDEYVV